MSSFTDYEKHHLHNYVHKKETFYTKQAVDIKMAVLKSEIPDVVQASELLNLSETLFWESYQLADCLYKIDRGIPSDILRLLLIIQLEQHQIFLINLLKKIILIKQHNQLNQFYVQKPKKSIIDII